MTWQGFPKLFRLTKRVEFDAVFSTQLKATDPICVVHARPNGLGRPRFGIVVGRRIKRAVDRNRLKRLYREAFRLNRESLANGWDFVIIPRKSGGLTLDEAAKSLVRLTGRLSSG